MCPAMLISQNRTGDLIKWPGSVRHAQVDINVFFPRKYDPFQRNERFIFAVILLAAPKESMTGASWSSEMVVRDRKPIAAPVPGEMC